MNRGRLAAFDLRGRHRPRPGAGPLAIVCGLPVLVRNLLLIERAGFRRALILADPIDRSLAVSALKGARRLAIECVWIDDAGDSLGPVLAAVPPGGAEVLYWPGELSCGRFLPDLATADVHPDGALVEHVSAGAARPGLILFGARALSAIRNDTAAQLVANLDRQGRVVVAPAAPQVVAVSSASEVSRAEAALLQSLRKDVDGISAKYNRHVSLAISARLMRFPVRPNHATAAAMLIGIASGLLAARGGYAWLLAGAVCYLVNNILDGIDGEIARAKLLESRCGQWFDTLSDDLTNMSFVVGLAIGSYRTWHANVYLTLGVVAGAGLVIIAAVQYHYLMTVAHCGDLNAFRSPWERDRPHGVSSELTAVDRVKQLLRRDTFAYVALVAALFGQARVAVWLATLGTMTIWVAWAVYVFVLDRDRRDDPSASPSVGKS